MELTVKQLAGVAVGTTLLAIAALLGFFNADTWFAHGPVIECINVQGTVVYRGYDMSVLDHPECRR